MTPLYKGNDYYKKMLDLQERLRKSEEERIRLEERFSLLEHESRSRHETCINRLRMRYIDFLEEQQERDERNHQLLGALDRVDNSLAVMTAKTDRLGALRKQHEASILASYDNRRPNGSVTGDSGVASQNDERQRKNSDFSRMDRSQPLLSTRHITSGHRVSASRNGTPNQTRAGSSYGSTWSGIRCETSQMPSFAFSRFPQGGTSLTTSRENGSSTLFLDNFDNTRNFRRSNNLSPLQHRDSLPQNSPVYDYRTNNSSRYGKPEYPLLSNTSSTIPPLNSRYDRSVVRDLATSAAYESVAPAPKFFDLSPVHSRGPNPYEQTSGMRNLPRNDVDDVLRRNSIFSTGQNSTYDDRKNVASISSRSPKLSEILRQEFDDEEEYVGSMVENQLERYISKIRSLHRDADPQSLEEIDHEQNTSGDLLNVTLSEDGYDLPVEEKLRDRELSRELGNALTIANDLANQTADHISRNVPTGEFDERIADDEVKLVNQPLEPRGKNNVPTSTSGVSRELASINRLLGKTESHDYPNDSTNEKIAILAKNGISGDIARPRAELVTRPCKNIEEIAKPSGNSREAEFGKIESRRIGASDVGSRNFNEGQTSNENKLRQNRDKLARRSSIVRELEKSRREFFSGEERETDENLYDIAEDLEPWNLSALERRVQEIILNDEAQDDFIRRNRETSGAEQADRAISGIYDAKWDSESRINERKIEESIAGNDETRDPNERWKNETSVDHERSTILETTKDLPSKNEEEPRLKNSENISSVLGIESINQSSREHEEESPKVENVGEANSVIGDNLVESRDENETKEIEKDSTNPEKDSYVAQEEYPEDTNLQYEYNADGQYHGDADQQYSATENSRDNGEQNEQYGYADQQYGNEYVEDPNQQGYVQDPNQQYVADLNQQEYMVDPNQQGYNQDSNAQGYVPDPSNESEYVEGSNQQYVQDSNQQYTDPHQQDYSQDPNQQYVDPNQQDYIQDPNQQYTDPNQQDYVQDPNQQYVDPNQQDYVQDPNQQYVKDPNQQYVEDPNQQDYVQDPNQQYVEDPNQQDYVQDPNQQYVDPNQQDYVQDPNQQYVKDPNQQDYVQDPNQQYVEDPNQQDYVQDPNQQYVEDPKQQDYVQDPNQQYFQDPNHHQYPAESSQEYPIDPNQQYATDPNEYVADPNHEYPTEVDPNQQYTSDVIYSEDGNQAYPAATTDYYPESQSYQNNEGHVSQQEGPEVGFETKENPRDTSEVVEDDSRKNEEVDRSSSASETNICPKEETTIKKTKDVIKSILDSDTESTIEKNVSNTESDFDFN